ncbi:lysophospholipid acyltransferase family protein [Litoreibacter roseus]|uniref:1-acyl-sn-glycerol-3-phosphate acyltransferase n=1 Tax=Litoreibacter roseus TaxID=2601869 RepID=A0A6N6JKE6_9RHOB|nr:lysophospholipid acyltransferase family protein [Litoreibacter roseus]GFE66793.1 1-acyl-sn-glycerol-3-phosphate acyltransferase [Litoreibacter roseus]
MSTWDDGTRPAPVQLGLGAWARILRRGIPLALVVFGGLGLLLLLRLIERPLHGLNRPWTPAITQAVCRMSLRILGLSLHVTGAPMTSHGAMVANHGSWLDIFVLNAHAPIYFVSKSEVAGWPGIGWLARATGTVFINRDRRDAEQQKQVLETRLTAGHRLLFFPEGTSSDGARILPFKSTLFAAFLSGGVKHDISVQPVTVSYTSPLEQDERFYGWWGDMEFGSHMLKVLATKHQGHVEAIYHEPLKVENYSDRKTLARAAERAVREGFSPSGAVPEVL